MNTPLTHFCPLLSLVHRGSQVTSWLSFSSTMQLLCYLAFSLLCSLPFLTTEQSIQCSETQYAWPVEGAKFCCNKCAPGEHMVRRSEDSCNTECSSCIGDRYSDSYNVDMYCNLCKSCNKPNMEYKSRCNITRNAVCRCKAGYRCKDQQCTQCLLIPATTSLPSSTAVSTPEAQTTFISPTPIRDTVWFLVIIALLCTGIALVVVAKIKPLLCWIRSRHGYFLTEKPIPVLPGSEEDVVSKPVQEVCGKCDQPIDICSDDEF